MSSESRFRASSSRSRVFCIFPPVLVVPPPPGRAGFEVLPPACRASPSRRQRGGAKEATLFDDLFLETLDKRDYLVLFGLGHLEPRQGRGSMTEEHVPVALIDAHASVGEHHVPAAVVHRSARARTEEVDQELFLAHDAVFPRMRPEAAELRIGFEPGSRSFATAVIAS